MKKIRLLAKTLESDPTIIPLEDGTTLIGVGVDPNTTWSDVLAVLHDHLLLQCEPEISGLTNAKIEEALANHPAHEPIYPEAMDYPNGFLSYVWVQL